MEEILSKKNPLPTPSEELINWAKNFKPSAKLFPDGSSAIQKIAEETEICLWKVYDEETNPYWESECGSMFQFNNGDWQANHFTFCPYCGKKIRDE